MSRLVPGRVLSVFNPEDEFGSLICRNARNDGPDQAFCVMDPDYRHLQVICERQAILTSNEEARKALEDMADQYVSARAIP
jgi:hypothetical protein